MSEICEKETHETYARFYNKMVEIKYFCNCIYRNISFTRRSVGRLKYISKPRENNERIISLIRYVPDYREHIFTSNLINFEIRVIRTRQTRKNIREVFDHFRIREILNEDVLGIIDAFLITDYEKIEL